MATYTNHLDWTSYTAPYSDEFWEMLPRHAAFELQSQTYGMGRYKTAYELACGAKVLWNENMPGIGIMVDIPGKACSKMRDMGFTDNDLMKFIRAEKMSATRMDYCINIHDERVEIDDLRVAHEKKQTYCAVNQIDYRKQIQGGEGYTFIVGGERSHCFTRIYDKAAQLKVPDVFWTRIELQTRQKHSRAFLTDAIKRSARHAMVSKVKKNFHAHKVKWWSDALNAPDVAPEPTEKTTSDWQKWMLDTVMKSYLKNLPKNKEFCGQFLADMQAAFYQQFASDEE